LKTLTRTSTDDGRLTLFVHRVEFGTLASFTAGLHWKVLQ
jgi:hypothetical protein